MISGLTGFWKDADQDARKALLAASMGWLLDAFDVMLYALILTSVIEELGLSAAQGGLMASLTLGCLGGRRPRLRRHCRQARTHAGVVAQHPPLLGVHVCVRTRPEPLAVRRLPRAAGARHGWRVGERGHARQRNLAGEASRQSARHHAELLGDRLRPRRDRRCDRVATVWMARGVFHRHHSGDLHVVDSTQREGT